MKQLRSPARLVRMWQRRERAAAVPVAPVAEDAPTAAGTMRSAFTVTGLAVEDQVRKVHRPGPGGLAVF